MPMQLVIIFKGEIGLESLGDAAKRLLEKLEARVAKEGTRHAAGALGMRDNAPLASPFCAQVRRAENDNRRHASTSGRWP